MVQMASSTKRLQFVESAVEIGMIGNRERGGSGEDDGGLLV